MDDSEIDEIKEYQEEDEEEDIDYEYPHVDDPNLQGKIYKKREFYYYKLPERPNLKDYKAIEDYRRKICRPTQGFSEHQKLLSNFINPDTPYKGVLVFHGTGTGKCVIPNTNILVNDRYTTIEQLWDNYQTEIIINIEENYETTNISSKLFTKSYDIKNRKIINGKILYIYREYINTNVMNITFEDGSQLTKTFSHKLLTIDLKWKCFLSLNDKILTYKNYEIIPLKVTNITIENYDGFVYDLEIDTYHNYVANGIINHNTCVGVAIAEKFKPLVTRYGTQIYIVVPGPLLKE